MRKRHTFPKARVRLDSTGTLVLYEFRTLNLQGVDMAGDARLGSVLRHMREDRGLSLKAAAAKLGTERHATVSEIEAGKRNASFSEIVVLASLYGVTLPDVLAAASGEEEPLQVAVALPRADGSLTEGDRIAIAQMERAARDYISLKGVLSS